MYVKVPLRKGQQGCQGWILSFRRDGDSDSTIHQNHKTFGDNELPEVHIAIYWPSDYATGRWILNRTYEAWISWEAEIWREIPTDSFVDVLDRMDWRVRLSRLLVRYHIGLGII